MKVGCNFCNCRSPRYKFIVQRLPYSDYKVKQEIPIFESSTFENLHNDSRRNRRIVRKRFSVRIEFSQAGRIGKVFGYDFSELLLIVDRK